MNHHKQSRKFWRFATQLGLRNYFYYFMLLKFRDNFRKLSKAEKNIHNDRKANEEYLSTINIHADNTGGFISKYKLKITAKQINVPYHTLRKWIPKLVKKGLLIETYTGYKMISMTKAAAMVGIKLEKLVITGKTKDELKSNEIRSLVVAEKKRQEVLTHNKLDKKTMLGNISCKRIALAMGLKSATSGCRIEKIMERNGVLIIERGEKLIRINTHEEECEFLWKRPCNKLRVA